MYNPEADADAIMEDYYQKFYGAKAAPFMKEYWLTIDDAVAKVDCHSGSFFWIPMVYTPEFLNKLGKSIDRAILAAKDEPHYAERVALHAEGYKSAVEYRALWEAMNRGDFATAKKVYDAYVARVDGLASKGWANPEYATAYMRRFNGKTVAMGATLLAAPNRLLQVLPDTWRMTYDPEGKGIEKKYAEPAFDDSGWKQVATYTKTLSGQGLPDRTEVLWYRTSFEVQAKHESLSLFFGEIDGLADVYVNGKKIEPPAFIPPKKKAKKGKEPEKAPEQKAKEPEVNPGFRGRAPFEVDVTDLVKSGRNIVVVRVNHAAHHGAEPGRHYSAGLSIGKGEETTRIEHFLVRFERLAAVRRTA